MKSKNDFPYLSDWQEYLRAYYAGLAMQGLLASGWKTNEQIGLECGSPEAVNRVAGILAVEIADETIKYLNETSTPTY